MTVNVRRWSDIGNEEKKVLFSRSETDISDVSDVVSGIISEVRSRGDDAIRELSHRFDGAPRNYFLRVPESHFGDARTSLSSEVKKALEYSVENVRRYHADQMPDGISWKEIRPGVMAGERTGPIDSAGFYVPRARGSFPSMLYMMAVPAQIAGVKRIAMASPPDSDGRVDPACLYTAQLCGVHEVYAMGGAQAWAAFAYGTETVKPVDKCLGPGSKYVASAKRLLSDVLDCGLPAGPSESIILADGSPDPTDVARNLLVEAEHGSDSAALLITDSPELARRVATVLSDLGDALPEPRRTFVTDVLSGYGGILLVDSIEEGADLANRFATEHLQIRTADPFATLGLIRHAGEILLGNNIPFSAANYSVGANAVLPTGGHARTWSGVSVGDFKKRSSIVYLTEGGLDGLKSHAAALADYEGFPAHRRALTDWRPAAPLLREPVQDRIQTLDEAFGIFESRTNLEKGLPMDDPNRVYRLDRMNALCAAFDNPQDALRVVHIAGSKGKGSTAAYIAALLNAAGRTVGVYTSPHLTDYRERFTVVGKTFPETTALKIAQGVLESLKELEEKLPGEGGATTFELLTLFGFLLFQEAGCDTIVLETGLGGRLDATNVVLSPEAVVFTPIEKEHTEILGNRLGQIAREKAGILKTGTPAWSAGQKVQVKMKFRHLAGKSKTPITFITSRIRRIRPLENNRETDNDFPWELTWRDGRIETIQLSMGGRIQAENAALALEVARNIEPDLLNREETRASGLTALSGVNLPGRFQRLRRRPLIVIDGAHTPRSVSAVADAFIRSARTGPDAQPLLLFGSVDGKNHGAMARELCSGPRRAFREVIVSTPGGFKPSNPPKVAESFRRAGGQVTLIPDPSEAWNEALRRSGGLRPILVTGSFYMAGEIARIAGEPFTGPS